MESLGFSKYIRPYQIPLAFKVKFPGGSQSLCQIPRLGNLLWALEDVLLTVQKLLWYNCSPICGSPTWWLYSEANSDLLQEDLCHMLPLLGPLLPEPLSSRQGTADPCLHKRYSKTKAGPAQSLVEVTAPFPWFWCAQGFVCTLSVTLASMRSDFKRDCTPPIILLWLLLARYSAAATGLEKISFIQISKKGNAKEYSN